MNRKRAVIIGLPIFILTAVYLCIFWYGRLAYYGMGTITTALVLTGVSLFLAIYRPIPVKIRSICILYLLVFGAAADFLNLFLRGSVWSAIYGSGIFVMVCGAAALFWGYMNGKQVKRKFYQVNLNRSIPQNLRVALLSDIHMGLCVDRWKLIEVCKKIEAEKPDLFFIAGDICDDQTKYEDMLFSIETLGAVAATYGTYCVLGNHDLGAHGPALQYTEQDLRQAMRQANIRVIDDECIEKEAFTVIGRRDPWFSEVYGGRIPICQLVPEHRADHPILLLDHQPYHAKEAAVCGVDIQFSGHTHAGQVWPISWFGRVSPTFYGLHYFESMALIVSSGLGGRGNRLRSGCSAEYVMIEIKNE